MIANINFHHGTLDAGKEGGDHHIGNDIETGVLPVFDKSDRRLRGGPTYRNDFKWCGDEGE